ncbi:MAG: hypothetical protein OCU22_07550 [Canidatus Methanoxibalbensis ujae]|nr:hypothetical protein [Candidatus Methanoxibalbensis ujae]
MEVGDRNVEDGKNGRKKKKKFRFSMGNEECGFRNSNQDACILNKNLAWKSLTDFCLSLFLF